MDTSRIAHCGDVPDEKVRASAAQIAALPSLTPPLVLFADARIKDSLDAPRSSAAAASAVIPELAPPTLGCAMTLIRTDLTKEDVPPEIFKKIVREILDGRIEEPGSPLRDLLAWIGITKVRKNAHDPHSTKELVRMLIDAPGSALAGANPREVRRVLPRSARVFCNNIGFDRLAGNHYLGCYAVEDISDESQAASWGLGRGKLIFALHAEGIALPFIIGRYFTQRRKFSGTEQVIRFLPKVFFHFGGDFWARLRYYFATGWHEIPMDSREGRRFLLAARVALAAAYVHHDALAQRVIGALRHAAARADAALLMIAPHYSITKETIGGSEIVVHRNGAARAVPGGPLTLMGHEDMRSYVCRAPQILPDHTWHSAPYSYGALVRERVREGKAGRQGGQTLRYEGGDLRESIVPHVDDAEGERALKDLSRGVLEQVAVLRPLYVYFGGKK